jgi:hypothetical protein
MDGKVSFTFPNIRNNTVQGSIPRLLPRDIAHNTEFPNIKFRLNVIRRNVTSSR